MSIDWDDLDRQIEAKKTALLPLTRKQTPVPLPVAQKNQLSLPASPYQAAQQALSQGISLPLQQLSEATEQAGSGTPAPTDVRDSSQTNAEERGNGFSGGRGGGFPQQTGNQSFGQRGGGFVPLPAFQQSSPVLSSIARKTVDGALPESYDESNLTSPSGNTAKGVGDYLAGASRQVLLGHYTPDNNLLGTGAQLALGLAGLDLPMDVRDLIYDLTHRDTPLSQTALDTLAFLPVLGDIKYLRKGAGAAEDIATGLKAAGQTADSWTHAARDLGRAAEAGAGENALTAYRKTADDLAQAAEDSDGWEAAVRSALRDADKTAGELVTEGAGERLKTDDITSIYRAVGPDEFYDLFDVKQFRPGPKSTAVKYFGRDFNETLKFADWTPDASAIIEVKIPQRILNEIGNFTPLDSTIFRKGTVMIQPENLDVFNESITGFYHVF